MYLSVQNVNNTDDLRVDKNGKTYTTLSLSKAIEKYYHSYGNAGGDPGEELAEISPYHYINIFLCVGYLLQSGYTLTQSSALTALMYAESKCNSSYYDKEALNTASTSSNNTVKYNYACGLLGFKGYDRKKKLLSYINAPAPDVGGLIERCSIQQQIQMIDKELKNDVKYKSLKSTIDNNSNNGDIILKALYNGYSNQKEPYNTVLSYANTIYNKYNK